ncbi:KH domain-containing protein [Humibacter ginsenosidimutans]|uniref:DUF4258 domain-containing protein n=1 Tax=Humibacter ginsenosidimutans TaxID=2599293 RepID=A0A5B8M6F1_9MICO|nr:KH domain-containing protein [Humibacter ginsenosidimutans]QDZ15090.1 DUF4258 domain-containing protein [Humibacter ginsenosidimutans]
MHASWLWLPIAVVVLALVIVLAVRARRRQGPRARVGASVRYTNHARERMAQRGVTAVQLESVLAKPARVDRDVEENSVRLEGDFDDRVLKVWVAEPWPSAGEIVVKSTAWNHVARFMIPAGAVGRVKGRGGATIRSICLDTGAQISIEKNGAVRIHADDKAAVDAARRKVMSLARR